MMNAKVLEVIQRAQSFTVRSADGLIEEVIPFWTEERLCAEVESIIAEALAAQEAEIARLRGTIEYALRQEGRNHFRLHGVVKNALQKALLPPDEKKETPK